MKKIVIIYATAGIGHKKASLAVKAALDEIAPKDVEVSIIDSLDYTNAFFKRSYLNSYLLMVNKLSLFWGFSYYLTDNRYFNLLISKMRRLNNWLNSKPLVKYLLDKQPDVIISTHFLATEVISDMKKSGALKSHLVTVVTDYRLHSWWIADCVDTYVVADDDAKDDLLKWGTDISRIKVLGIPVEPVFSRKLNKAEILEKAGLKKGVFTILVIGGGFGVGPIEDIIKVIGGIPEPIQIITVCGHNEQLVKKIEDLKAQMGLQAKIVGYVNNVYEYMEAADIMISKSGGITVSEALTKELPIIIIAPIIGQETRNSDFLIKHGAALKIDKPSDLKALLEGLVAHPEKMENLRRAISFIRKPTACYDIAKLAITICHEK